MLRLSVFLIILILVNGCFSDQQPEPFCDVSDPATDLSWLRELIFDFEDAINQNNFIDTFWIRQFTYQEQEYFIQGSCCASCFYLPVYYSCQGDTVEFVLPQEEADSFRDIINNGEVIWQGGSCSF